MKWKEEDLEAFKARTAKWKEVGTTRTHLMPGKDIVRKPSKYRNKKTEVDGRTFDSQREASRYQELRLMEKAGEIDELETQVRFALRVNREEVCCYIADFTYRRKTNGRGLVVEDVKGHRTREYIIKKKLMKAIHGIEVLET